MCSPRWGWGCPVASQDAHDTPATGPKGLGEGPWLACPVCTVPPPLGVGLSRETWQRMGPRSMWTARPNITTPLGLSLGMRDMLEGLSSASGASKVKLKYQPLSPPRLGYLDK